MSSEVTLNKVQLKQISKFIKSKGVNYYDVNLEMTDHISSEVEELMDVENLKFREAVKEVFLRYKRFHFMNIEDEKIEFLQKQSWNEFKKGIIQFFTIPKIAITALLFFCNKYLIEMQMFEHVSIGIIVLIFLVLFALFYLKRKWVGKGKYLQLSKYHWAIPLVTNVLMQITFNLTKSDHNINSIIGASVATVTFLVLYISAELYTKELVRLKKQLI